MIHCLKICFCKPVVVGCYPLEGKRQEDPWGLLVSQSSLIGKRQASETPYFKISWIGPDCHHPRLASGLHTQSELL